MPIALPALSGPSDAAVDGCVKVTLEEIDEQWTTNPRNPHNWTWQRKCVLCDGNMALV